MSLRDSSIRRKLSLLAMSTCLTALVTACLGFAVYERSQFRASRVVELSTLADTLGANTAASLAFNDPKTARVMLSSLRRDGHILAAFLYDERGNLFAEYRRDRVEFAAPEWHKDGHEFDHNKLTLFRGVLLDGDKTGTIAIVSDLSGFDAKLWGYVKIAAIVLVVSLVPSLLLSSRLIRFVSDPIVHLFEIAARISSQEDFSLRVSVDRKDELGQLMSAFNHMLDCIHQRDCALQEANDTLEVRVRERTQELQREITERKRAEQALRASKERYQLLYNYNLAAVFHSSQGKILDCNEAMCRMLGYSREELHALDLRELYCEPHARNIGQKILYELGQLKNYEVQLRRRDGTAITVLANLNLVGEDEYQARIVAGVMLDITEIRALQEQLSQTQKLDAIGKLTGGIAHDFNNIIMIINSYSEMILDQADLQGTHRRPLEQIRAAGDRAASLTKQLLAFSRKQVLCPVVVDLAPVLVNFKDMLKRLLGEDISLQVSSVADLWATKTDPSQIEQIVLNLALNARDAMPKGGTLTISAVNVELREDFIRTHPGAISGQYVAIEVSDSGAGISSEVQPHIFEPFFTTKGLGKGTGLGLSTVYGIVKQSGGYITVESELGRGTTFCIYLPRTVEPLPTRIEDAVAVEAISHTTVLLAEDEEATREAIAAYLQRNGFRVVAASNGEEALHISERPYDNQIDVLLTDVIMPGMSGIDLAHRFRGRHPNAKIVFMSGYTDDVLARSGMNQSHETLLMKPFRLPDLVGKLKHVLAN